MNQRFTVMSMSIDGWCPVSCSRSDVTAAAAAAAAAEDMNNDVIRYWSTLSDRLTHVSPNEASIKVRWLQDVLAVTVDELICSVYRCMVLAHRHLCSPTSKHLNRSLSTSNTWHRYYDVHVLVFSNRIEPYINIPWRDCCGLCRMINVNSRKQPAVAKHRQE